MPKIKKIPVSVQKALTGEGVRIPQVAELVSHFLAAAGGPKFLARMLLEEYHRAKSGSIIRQRILDSVLRLLTFANQTMLTVDEIDLLSNDDLQAELATLMEEIPDGEAEETGTGDQSGND